MTLDGVGEWTTTSYGYGRGAELHTLAEIKFPHSLGLFYTAITYFTGFKPNSGEYKLMGLAPYGQPRYADLMLEHLIDLKEDGSFKLNMPYFNYMAGLTMTSDKMADLFDGPARQPPGPAGAPGLAGPLPVGTPGRAGIMEAAPLPGCCSCDS